MRPLWKVSAFCTIVSYYLFYITDKNILSVFHGPGKNTFCQPCSLIGTLEQGRRSSGVRGS